jgi:hypothetical protein
MELAAHLSSDVTLTDRVIKVNHAGENRAVNICRAQRLMCWWRDAALKADLYELRVHEETHRAIFAAAGVPPWRNFSGKSCPHGDCRDGIPLRRIGDTAFPSTIRLSTCGLVVVTTKNIPMDFCASLSRRHPSFERCFERSMFAQGWKRWR